MKNLISGILAVALVAGPASAQQVTTTLPSATVKLNGASGGGSGTGFTYDAGEDAWIFTPPSGASDTRILSDYIGLQDASGTDILALSSTQGATTYIAARLAAGAIETRDYATLAATGTILGTNVQCSTGGGAVVGTLDASASTIGRFVYITRSGANTCTVGVESGHTLDGVTDGTTTVASAGWKTFVQSGDTAWVTQASYPATAGLTTGNVPYAAASGLADSPIVRESANITSLRNGTSAQEFKLFATYSSGGTNYEDFYIRTSGSGTWRIGTEKAGTGAARDIRFFPDGTEALRIGTTLIEPVLPVVPSTSSTISLGSSTALWRTLYHTYGQMGASSKALVDATATNVWQVNVNNNLTQGGTLKYTVFATDGTDRQARSGIVAFSVLNNGGTETCVFGTANDVVNVTSGTLTVSFDCSAGSDAVLIRATADTSLASTTTFTCQSRLDITSGTTTLTPQ